MGGITLISFITKKVNLREDSLLLNVLETISLIPPVWEHVERDLSPDAIRQAVVCKVGLESLHEVSADIVDLVVRFKVVTFLDPVFVLFR